MTKITDYLCVTKWPAWGIRGVSYNLYPPILYYCWKWFFWQVCCFVNISIPSIDNNACSGRCPCHRGDLSPGSCGNLEEVPLMFLMVKDVSNRFSHAKLMQGVHFLFPS